MNTTNKEKVKILKGSDATITRWKLSFPDRDPIPGRVKWIRRGTVEAAIGDTIQIKFVWFNFIVFKIYRCKWFSFSDEHYKINTKVLDAN